MQQLLLESENHLHTPERKNSIPNHSTLIHPLPLISPQLLLLLLRLLVLALLLLLRNRQAYCCCCSARSRSTMLCTWLLVKARAMSPKPRSTLLPPSAPRSTSL